MSLKLTLHPLPDPDFILVDFGRHSNFKKISVEIPENDISAAENTVSELV